MRVLAGGVDAYIAAFVGRCEVMRRPGQPDVDEPGVRGLLPSMDDPRIRLLVMDDRAYNVLAGLLADAEAGVITVLAAAARCVELVESHAGWKSDAATAMICRDLGAVTALPLPSELTLRPVRRTAEEPADDVPLADAVAAVMRADPRIDSPDAFADYLRSLPPTVRLLCAVDGNGSVRATSGSDTFGKQANIFFVNTDPNWRGRGIGAAMTAAALRTAEGLGARQAYLDASGSGLSIYLRLGFEPVTPTVRFSRTLGFAHQASRATGVNAPETSG